MPTESFTTSTVVPGRAEQIYDAWIDGRQHGEFTNEEVESDPRVGGSYTAGTGYMGGKYLALEHGRRVLQSWRTTEFPEGTMDSRLEVLFEDVDGGTRVTLNHMDIPEGQGERYREGWATYYFEPMQAYFGSRFGDAPTQQVKLEEARPAKAPAAKKTAPAKKKTAAKAKAAAKAKRPAAKKKAPAKKKPAAKAKAKRPAAKKKAPAKKRPAAKAKRTAAKKRSPARRTPARRSK